MVFQRQELTEQESRFLAKIGQTQENILKGCAIVQTDPRLFDVELAERILEKLLPPEDRRGKYITINHFKQKDDE